MKSHVVHSLLFTLAFGLTAAAQTAPTTPPVTVIPPPPQDQGLPYTRSAEPKALAKIHDGIAVFAGSRYGYIQGYRVRLDDTDLLRGEAVGKDGVVYVPGSFAAAMGVKKPSPPPVPAGLEAIADRWVYSPEEFANSSDKLVYKPAPGVATITVKDRTFYSFTDVAKALGLQVTSDASGMAYAGAQPLTFSDQEAALKQSVITLFDTPDKLADPDIATQAIPTLKTQGKWTDHVKVTPEQMAILNGPATDFPTAPKSDYDESGFNKSILGTKVPPPGVYPRLLFSPDDVPGIAARIKATRTGQESLIEMDYLFSKTFLDPKTDDGRVFQKLSTGDLDGLVFDAPPGTPLCSYPQIFKGEKAGIYNSHVAYLPECLTEMALYCLLTDNNDLGPKVATAISNYYKLREPLLDEWLAISDSEFGTSYTRPNGEVVVLDGANARTHWRNIHGLVAHMDLGLSLDFGGKWMTPEQRAGMVRIIAKATYGRRSYGQDGPPRVRDVNWMSWDLTHFLAVAEIQGQPGFDPEAYAAGAESVRAFCDWGIDNSGVVYESTGKNPGSLQFQTLSMIALARRGENLFGHPHYRRLLEGQTQMMSPDGNVIVTSGTQYSPYSRQRLSLFLVREFKTFYPHSRLADYLGTAAGEETGGLDGFDAAAFRAQVAKTPRLRLPGVAYPGMARNLLYDSDFTPTTRADVNEPLVFNDPVHGVFSAYSDRTPQAAWINLNVRPNHYIGAGHHHADAGMFHFSALGVNWFTQSPYTQEFDGNYYNLVQVDGKSEPCERPDLHILGYNGAPTYLGDESKPLAAEGSADLTYAYTWRWLTQPPQVWVPELDALHWEMDPSPNIEKIFAGTARMKMRFWWTNYTYSNYIATSRALYNPMHAVFRTGALVRGDHPYGLVVDDLVKDDDAHLYQWAGMLNGGVWQANVGGLDANEVALATTGVDPALTDASAPAAIEPKTGDPLLLVYALGLSDSGVAGTPLIQVEHATGPHGRKGEAQYFNRLMISRQTKAAAFRVLLLPVKAGDALPKVTYDAASQTAHVAYPGQTDDLKFTTGADGKTTVAITRAGETILP
jgi:hypothetical protein